MSSLQIQQISEIKKSDKIYGFDYLRAVCCLSVLVLHSNLPSLLNDHRLVKNILNFNFLFLSVPIFLQIALVLFFLNREKKPSYFINRRLPKLLQIYLYWGLISHLFNLLTNRDTYLAYLRGLDGWGFIQYVMNDGFSNPFYFFFSLLLTTCIAELLAICWEKTKSSLLLYTGMILVFLILIAMPFSVLFINRNWIFLAQVFNPLNFLPYIFSSFLLSQYLIKNEEHQFNNKNYYLQICIFLILFIGCAVLEWKYISNTIPWCFGSVDSLPPYTRISSVFAAWLITLISFQVKSPPNFVIKSLSDLSLGIYCFHTFVGITFQMIFMHQHKYGSILDFLLMLFGSVILTKIFKQIPILQDFV